VGRCCMCRNSVKMVDHLVLHCVVARELGSSALTSFGVHLVMPWTVIEVFTLSENLVIMKKARFVGQLLFALGGQFVGKEIFIP
jgi:hypothetical protein